MDELYNYFQGGSIAVYEHVAMIKLHYSIADELEECIKRLEFGKSNFPKRRRHSVPLPDCRRPLKMIETKEPSSILRFILSSQQDDPDLDGTVDMDEEDFSPAKLDAWH